MGNCVSCSSSKSSSSKSAEKKRESWSYQTVDFANHGPKHLPCNWWVGEKNQSAVVACLINGVYVLEQERRLGENRDHTLSEPWWESFGYTLLEKVFLPNRVIFGAIYAWNHKHMKAVERAPTMVLAFRGTVPEWDEVTELGTPSSTDMLSAMLKVAMDKIHSLHQYAKPGNVGLCGHSLGAAMALIGGKRLASSGVYLETFLFNPPIVLDYLSNGTALDTVLDGESMGSNPVGLLAWNVFALAKKLYPPKESEKCFRNLVKWKPRLLVNKEDFICNGYINYYEARNTGEDACYLELGLPFVTPSAFVIVNEGSSEECHEIKQWWDCNLTLQNRPSMCFDRADN